MKKHVFFDYMHNNIYLKNAFKSMEHCNFEM